MRALRMFVPSLALGVFAGQTQCGPAEHKASPGPSTPSAVAATPSLPASASVSTSASVVATAAPIDPSTLTPLLAHAALGGVAAAMAVRDPKAAAEALDKALASLTGLDVDRGAFLLGRLRAQAKQEELAEAAYAKVSTASPLLSWAALRRAQLALKRGKPDDALALLKGVPDAAPLAEPRHFALGEALAAKGDHAGAAEAYALERTGHRWTEAAIRFAEEVAAAGDKKQAILAAKGARRVRFEYPASSLAPRALDAEQKCLLLVPTLSAPEGLGAPTALEQATRAQGFLDASKAKDARDEAKNVLLYPKGTDAWCKAALVHARALERLKDKAGASDAYGVAAEGCPDETTHVNALYDGAKAALAAKNPTLARARFLALEKEHGKHRLADDARLRGAQVAIDSGDVVKGEAMLASLPDDYPEGDMKAEALFRLAFPRLKSGDFAGALPHLDRSIALVPREDGYFTQGRAAYYAARARLETGKVKEGVEGLRKVIADEPLSFAAAMAYARLASRGKDDAALAKKALDDGLAFEPQGDLFDKNRKELATPGFARAVEFARVGEPDFAKKELAVLGLLKDADPAGLYVTATLLARAGDARGSHNLARGRLTDWVRHFPSGKWKAAWELAFPRPYEAEVVAAATRESVPTALIWAIMREESAFDPEVVSPSSAYGLMQLILPTAARYAKPLKLAHDAHALTLPEVNIPIGTAFLRKLRGEFPENPNGYTVPSYNAGEGATHKWLAPPLAGSFDLWVESIPYDETRKYTKRVLASYFAYVALYAPTQLEGELRVAAGK